jgi:formylglycine-generating enzyme required for sulfatase activity/serine/threonine protein kinase
MIISKVAKQSMSNLIGQTLFNQYRIDAFIASGGMADVYRATDLHAGKIVAFKVIQPQNIRQSEQFLLRFRREAKVMARLEHSNIVRLLDYGDMNGHPFMVMEYLQGGTLCAQMNGRQIAWRNTAAVILPIVQALEYAHSQNVIHRDIKPGNIIFTGSGQPKLADFGVAKIVAEEMTLDLTGTNMPIGTAAYMAPEQARGKSEARSDIYSLGVVMYEMLSGQKLFEGDTPFDVMFKHASESPAPLRRYVTSIPQEAEQIVMRCLAKHPQERFENMSALAYALRRGITDDRTAMDEEPPRPPVRDGKDTGIKKKEPRGDNTDSRQSKHAARQREVLGWMIPIILLLVVLVGVGGNLFSGSLSVQEIHTELPISTPIHTLVVETPDVMMIRTHAVYAAAAELTLTAAPFSPTPQAEYNSHSLCVYQVQVGDSLGSVLINFNQVDNSASRYYYCESDPVQRECEPRLIESTLNIFPGWWIIIQNIGNQKSCESLGGLWTQISQTPMEISTPIISTSTPVLDIGSTTISDKDGMTMVFVPAGEFTMGSGNGEEDEKPVHQVYLDAFWIDQTEVTNAMYAKCVDAGVCKEPTDIISFSRSSYYGNSEFDDYPVLYVDWEQAYAYCSWADGRLPTEAEWEKAAHGTGGKTYPWGENISCDKANYKESCVGDTTKVGSYPDGIGPYGVYDMAGNVWEWVNDWYGETYYQSLPSSNPLGPDSGQYRVLRGGSWGSNDYFAHSTDRFRYYPSDSNYSRFVGFRCVRSLP